jgi:hypothetical protein
MAKPSFTFNNDTKITVLGPLRRLAPTRQDRRRQ